MSMLSRKQVKIKARAAWGWFAIRADQPPGANASANVARPRLSIMVPIRAQAKITATRVSSKPTAKPTIREKVETTAAFFEICG